MASHDTFNPYVEKYDCQDDFMTDITSDILCHTLASDVPKSCQGLVIPLLKSVLAQGPRGPWPMKWHASPSYITALPALRRKFHNTLYAPRRFTIPWFWILYISHSIFGLFGFTKLHQLLMVVKKMDFDVSIIDNIYLSLLQSRENKPRLISSCQKVLQRKLPSVILNAYCPPTILPFR